MAQKRFRCLVRSLEEILSVRSRVDDVQPLDLKRALCDPLPRFEREPVQQEVAKVRASRQPTARSPRPM